jgi:Cft2 family RNA processing exonuclease
MTLVEYGDKRMLIEAGMTQSNDMKTNYIKNKRMVEESKPSTLDFVFLMHSHA